MIKVNELLTQIKEIKTNDSYTKLINEYKDMVNNGSISYKPLKDYYNFIIYYLEKSRYQALKSNNFNESNLNIKLLIEDLMTLNNIVKSDIFDTKEVIRSTGFKLTNGSTFDRVIKYIKDKLDELIIELHSDNYKYQNIYFYLPELNNLLHNTIHIERVLDKNKDNVDIININKYNLFEMMPCNNIIDKDEFYIMVNHLYDLGSLEKA
ncbi:hypothetical protein CPT_Madawaska_010 [Staphylococcus phage Madawaska]|nr:hypothetical protein CPT_Madawaska_010 [Staphylococcus phage Madawaska]